MEIGDWSRKIGEWSLGARGVFGSRRGVADQPARVPRRIHEELLDATCNCLSIVRFAHGPKISIRRLLGPQKNSNLFRGADGPKWSAAPAESCQSAAQRSPGARFMMVLDVGKRLHACAGASIGRDISVQVLSQTSGQSPSPPSFRSRALWGAPSTGACGVGDYPTPDLSQRESGSRSTSEKSK